LIASPIVREAIFVASPDLERSIEAWLAAPDSNRGLAAERGLIRYITRMASRPTPFGLFAGTATGVVADRTVLRVPPASECRRHTRLDMDYLVPLAESLARDPRLAESLRYAPNTSLHQSADRWHYVESHAIEQGRRHHLVAVDDSEPVRAVFEAALSGATRADLIDTLAADDITASDAAAFVDELIASQILVPDLECPITGTEPLAALIDALERHEGGQEAAGRLTTVAQALTRIDRSMLGAPPASYNEIAQTLEPFGVPIVPAKLFQVDLVKPGDATLGRDIVDEIARGVEVLRRLMPAATDDALAKLRAAFEERYEQREVPLFDALDEETGIGSALGEGRDRDASPLLEDIHFGVERGRQVQWTTRESRLLRRVGEALVAGRTELALTSPDVDELANDEAHSLPTAYAAMATIVAKPADLVGPRRDFRVLLQSATGPSGATLLGRFSHGDAELARKVAGYLRAEEATDPDAVFAEVVHLPEGRIGNILLRPLMREYEIVYLGRSGAPVERQLPIGDLLLSTEGDRFVLRSARLGRRVIPRLTSAHNFQRLSVGLYRFLCLLQGEGSQRGCFWTWGPLEQLPFLPRVTTGRVVLSRARWQLTAEEMRPLYTASGTARFQTVQRWRDSRRLPRWVVLSDYDNALVVDLDNVVAIDSFVQMLRERDEATLVECYPSPEALCAEGADGAYVHEIVVPFIHPQARAATKVMSRPRAMSPLVATRHALPGSPWVYAKLYTGNAAADRVLVDALGPQSRTWLDNGDIDRWFFIRYTDPDHHVRWRLHVADARRLTTIRKAVEKTAARLFDQGRIRRVTFDTYHREIERYGGPDGLDAAEQLFWADSDAILDLLATLSNGTATANSRWQSAILGVDALLADLGFDHGARLAIVGSARESWGRRVGVDADARRQLGKKFRKVQVEVAPLLDGDVGDDHPLVGAAGVFAARSRRNQAIAERLHALSNDARLDRPLALLAESYVHMHLNRLFRAEQNLHEVVIYDFLVQLYTRRLARLKGTNESRERPT
jgi:thiopeptide-type bacteriocin biosynthesis protein